ncbi:WD domain-containing protein, partial [Hortaea werneckii]
GQTKRALFLIIGELGDVRQAISFAKENGELWDDLLDYSMDKPHFIKGLLEEVGTTIDPVKMVRRIPEGLEIEGLKHGIQTLVREFEIQYSISEGVAKVLRGEVAMGMDTLRAGRKKAVRFDVAHEGPEDVDISTKDVPTALPDGQEALPVNKRNVESKAVKPGHCVGCGDPFSEEEREPLIGFACGHVYHLTCILRANPDTDDEDKIDRLLEQLGRGDNDGENYSGRSVGAKVAHAHIIKNVVQGGCRHCFVPEGA